MNWKAQLGVGLLIVAVAVAGVWLWRDSVWREKIANSPAKRDTVVFTEPFVLPKPDILPNPAPSYPRPDLTNKRKVDSLLSVVVDKDSLIRDLMSTAGTEQRFMSKDPTGLDVSGTLTVIHSPVEKYFLTDITLDTVQIPVKFISVEHTVVNKTVSWEWILTAACVGGVVGALLNQ